MSWLIGLITAAFIAISAHASSLVGWTTRTALHTTEHVVVDALPASGGNSVVLGRAIGCCKPGWVAHHIIPESLKDHRVLGKVSFYLDDAANGIALPKKAALHRVLPVHASRHPLYTAAARAHLDAIPENLSVDQTRTALLDVQQILRKCLARGTPIHIQFGAPSPWGC